MQFRVFNISVTNPTCDELNKFVASHKIVHLDREFVSDGANSFWSVFVTFADATSFDTYASRKESVDYKKVLPPEQFELFSKLRELRKELAEKESVPVYAVFTNEQLAEIVRKEVVTVTGIEKIPGVGKSKREKYGKAVVDLMLKNQKQVTEEDG